MGSGFWLLNSSVGDHCSKEALKKYFSLHWQQTRALDWLQVFFRFSDTFCNYPLLPLEGRILAIKKVLMLNF